MNGERFGDPLDGAPARRPAGLGGLLSCSDIDEVILLAAYRDIRDDVKAGVIAAVLELREEDLKDARDSSP